MVGDPETRPGQDCEAPLAVLEPGEELLISTDDDAPAPAVDADVAREREPTGARPLFVPVFGAKSGCRWVKASLRAKGD